MITLLPDTSTSACPAATPDNRSIAAALAEAARLLANKGAQPYTIQAYERAAATVAGAGVSLAEVFHAQGQLGLRAFPGIGPGIAAAMSEFIQTGEWKYLTSLRGQLVPQPAKAANAVTRRQVSPPVALLLEIDRTYRSQTAPAHGSTSRAREMRARHGEWQFTALYSHTARARDLDRTHDWVVLRYEDERAVRGQYTIVTEARGALAGRRVIRGREAACRTYYRRTLAASGSGHR